MASDISPSLKRPTARRKDPACGTCRKKCRKCDRKRPICDRCRTRGLHCEGYPPRFQFCETVTAPVPSASPSGSLVAPEAPTKASTVDSISSQASLSPDHALRNFTTSGSPPPSSPAYSPSSCLAGAPDFNQDISSNRRLIEYFDQFLSEYLTIHVQGTNNPFREHVLPLVYQHQSILHALLGLSACHMHISGRNESQHFVTISLQYRVSALHSLGALLLQEEATGLTNSEEECVLGTVLLLVLHDVCETGISSHGTHLTGVAFLCKRLACPADFSTRSKASMFFISALSWLDMLRGFSGAEKLAYSGDVRKCVRDHGSLSLHALVGCPPVLFHRIGQVLEAGKSYLAGDLSIDQFQELLTKAEKFFRGWDPDLAIYPTGHKEWRHLAEAYRHACLLRVLRFPDAFVISCDDSRIKASVTAIFDVSGADTSSPHQMHYASWCIGEIKHATGFQHPAMTEILTKVWEERGTHLNGWYNVPWMEFITLRHVPTC
ncbi:uncharacterized protein TRUGW13939_04981 [Talaromyces rugulosus]|uniref:Zn(2)-C6 fungal-type domain-containing protein n=1 Tax=Talaromyces rugulosus TaxID=121627 RepID=A0A7H8QWN1_TALRU|nr:uncharacterized protein TRUGW13939_04981 [Talaromyces rugulosus]QKX57861.1 hypothetical protein TRUGW13939_04981 [Talaromyces rugulosus]